MQEASSVPRLIVSSYKGKNGKTVVALAIASAFIKSGKKVSMFKVGPDFIDPSYHQAITGEPSRNLDYMLMKDKIVERYHRYSKGKDIAIIEGMGGLYDSPDGVTEQGSTAQMAKALKAPVIMVVNGDRVNRTAGAIIRGMRDFDRDLKVVGAVLTNVVPNQVDKLSKVISDEGLELVGYISKSSLLEETMTYRHLGLEHAAEKERGIIEGAFIESSENINVEKVMQLAKENSGDLSVKINGENYIERSGITVGILSGKAFSFYYPETIEIATRIGDVKFIDPERDQSLGSDLVLIGGGFPEIYADRLERNRALRSSVKKFIENGGYLYAECGGLMYLSDSIVYRGYESKMVGVIDAVSVMMERPVGHSYARAMVIKDNPLAAKGTVLVGHEFHYSKLVLRSNYDLAIKYERGTGVDGMDGFVVNNSYAQFMHIHPETYDYISALAKRIINKK